MKAVYYESFNGPLEIRDLPDPEPHPDGAVIRVEATGICRSDWHGWQGHDSDIHLPHVPGHELAGVVEAVGKDVTRWKPGDRVTVPFAGGCGRCEQCQKGNQQICDAYFQPGFTGWGSFAEYVALRYAEANLVRLPETMSMAAAASLGCRFITSFRGVVQQGRAAAGETVAVHGCGGVGLSAIMIADALGASVVAVDIDEEKLAFARRAGAAYTINAREMEDVARAIHDLTGGAHLSLDALGAVETCRNSILSLRKRGRHVQVGLMAGKDADPPLPMSRVIAYELELYGSHGMQAHAYPPLLAMISAGKLDPESLVTRRVSLEESIEVLRGMGTFATTGVAVIDRFD
jgi:alcohol dehydrogenase